MKPNASTNPARPESSKRLSASESSGETARAGEGLGASQANVNLRTRREAIRLMGLAGAAGCAWMDCAAAELKEASGTSGAALDEAYRLLQQQEPQCKQGLSTHAP